MFSTGAGKEDLAPSTDGPPSRVIDEEDVGKIVTTAFG
jgi:hypothetical protein